MSDVWRMISIAGIMLSSCWSGMSYANGHYGWYIGFGVCSTALAMAVYFIPSPSKA